MAAQPWIPSRSGLPIDLVSPSETQVDFRDEAWALAHLNRYGGHPDTPVSVGLHLLIGFEILGDLGEHAVKPWWLLHDTHETRIGERTSPTLVAECAIAAEIYGGTFAEQLRAVRLAFAGRHDAAIHRAAGLPLPTAAQREVIRRADLMALATERRDFLRRGPAALRRPWLIDQLGIPEGRKAWSFIAPADVAACLYRLFQSHLPALIAGRAA
ncbi:hypothetical protein [Methylobacterium sp. WSM2598]|uniref:hypothetical protein n=1 Tax=Methylobacterium sp. WSM2598 TaxID=398261 RepID=UPI00036E0ED2|nr:hypothetical protein [Methylobacterium sp. WSM2598]